MAAKRSTDITESVVREALANLGEISDADRVMAQNALAKKGVPDDDDNVSLYLARVSRNASAWWVVNSTVDVCSYKAVQGDVVVLQHSRLGALHDRLSLLMSYRQKDGHGEAIDRATPPRDLNGRDHNAERDRSLSSSR